MKLWIAGLYVIGLALDVWFMAHIKAMVDRLIPLNKKASRPRGNAERLAEEINREYYTTDARRLSK